MDSNRPDNGNSCHGFPLAAMLLLMTSVACAFACIDIMELRACFNEEKYKIIIVCCGAGILVGILGGLSGLFSANRWRGFLSGLFIGFFVGVFTGILVMAPAHPLQAFSSVVILLVASIVLKWKSV